MAIPINDGSIVLVSLSGKMYGQTVLLTHTYLVNSTYGVGSWDMDPNFNEFVGQADGAIGLADVYADAVSVDLAEIFMTLQVIAPTRYVKRQYPLTNNVGTVAGAALPQNVAHVITVQTDYAGRRQRGNKHIGGVPASFSVDGELAGGGPGALADLKDVLVLPQTIAGTGDSIWTPVLYHRGQEDYFDIITTGIVQATTRTERRRTVGRGI